MSYVLMQIFFILAQYDSYYKDFWFGVALPSNGLNICGQFKCVRSEIQYAKTYFN